jgi:rare lipoprotein A
MDVSSRTADVLDFKSAGTAKIKVEYVGRAPLEGSDDNALLASLRTDGSPANLNGYPSPVMVASASDGAEGVPPPLQALWAQARAAPPPAPIPEPEPVRVAPAEPEPIHVAAAEPEPEPPPAPVRETTKVSPAFRHGAVPLPPSRPFDLGSIHAATVVAVASQPRPAPVAVTPPRRPFLQASAEKALY